MQYHAVLKGVGLGGRNKINDKRIKLELDVTLRTHSPNWKEITS
jgi:hypothetical protein